MTGDGMADLRGMPVLVTGAGGFIGRRLTAALVEAGAVVTAVGRSRPAPALANLPVRFLRADLSDAAAMAAAVAGQGVIFNLAYDVRASGAANLAAFTTLLNAAERAGTGRIVHLSSIVVYDGWPGGRVSEASPMADPGGGAYRQAKIAMEARLMAGRLPAAILQPTLVWGPGSALWTGLFCDRLANSAAILLPQPEGLFQGVYVDDVVQACLRAALVPDLARERFILNGPAPFRWSDLLQGYRDLVGLGAIRHLPAATLCPPPVPDGPDQGPSVAARLSALARRTLGHDRFETLVKRLRRTTRGGEMRPDAHLFALMSATGACPSDLARARLGYAPAFGLAEGLAALGPHIRPTRM